MVKLSAVAFLAVILIVLVIALRMACKFYGCPVIPVRKTVIEDERYKLVSNAKYRCKDNKWIDASYYSGPEVSVKPGEPSKPSGEVRLDLSDGRKLNLLQTISGSGIRYANSNESIVFWSKGETAFMTENNIETYSGCSQL